MLRINRGLCDTVWNLWLALQRKIFKFSVFPFFVGFPSDIVSDLVISDYSYCSFFVKRFHWKYCFQKHANLRQC